MVQNDSELQSWWKELQEEGHGDKKDEPWWPKMQTREELIETCTITIWICSLNKEGRYNNLVENFGFFKALWGQWSILFMP
jgi:hypothetical protein